ncbi:MAG: AAA family ATPase [Clostridiaceae bacterium]|nr:AAA family ATPase [Clostridiaceae bacterium]
MGIGIIVCGLNGSGKSTLGKALAEKLKYHFIDNENLFFPKTDPNFIFASPRSHEEVVKLLMNEVKAYQNFVFAAVKGDYGDAIRPLYNYTVLIDVPKNTRIERVKKRSLQRFGKRMLPGGDLYEQEESIFNMAASRTEQYVEEWVQTLDCPIIRVDGTKSVEENVQLICKQIHSYNV